MSRLVELLNKLRSVRKITFVLLCLLIALLTALALTATKLRNLTDTLKNERKENSRIVVPSKNKLVFTRCQRQDDYWGPRPIQNCSLYLAQLFRPETEQKIFTFDFPEVKDKNRHSNVILLGGVDNKVIYFKYLRETGDSKNEVGYVDIQSGTNYLIDEISNSDCYPEQGSICGIRIDSEAKKVFYIENGSPNEKGQVKTEFKQFDLITNENKLIASTDTFADGGFEILWSKDENLYLAQTGVFSSYSWTHTLNTNTGTISERPANIGPALTFANNGKIAWVEEKNLGNLRSLLVLKTSGIDGENEKELYQLSTNVPTDTEGGTRSFTDVRFAPNGTFLTTNIINYSDDYYTRPYETYKIFSFGEYKPQDQPTDLILPFNTKFKWAQQRLSTDQLGSPIIYKINGSGDNAWYLAPPINSTFTKTNNLTDLTTHGAGSQPQVITVGAEDLVLIP